ncbi:MAG: tetratricopeptide repeat protein [Deltaproteobacteria bacterium]|nr:tetratricopeptide repeat protein [Deltaproteobacteria bacterium]
MNWINIFNRALFVWCFGMLVFGTACCALAQVQADFVEVIKAGNDSYEKQDYVKAKESYESVLVTGFDNPHLRYNLGNAYYRLGEYGKSIANYRRAFAEIPRDPDLSANLSLARKKAIDKLDYSEDSWFSVFANVLLLGTKVSDRELRVGFLMSYACFWIIGVICYFKRTALLATSLALSLFVTVVCAVGTFASRQGIDGLRRFSIESAQAGVIVTKEAKVYSGNSDSFQVVFVLHDGAEVDVAEQRGEWLEIVLPAERSGWVKRQQIELL